MIITGLSLLPAAQILPDAIGPYMTLMVIGFGVGIVGHLFRWRLLVAIGIVLIFLATVVFPIAVNLTHDRPGEVLSFP
jgi:hypothetical protein